MSDSIRGKNCYICGEPLFFNTNGNNHVKRSAEMVMDRKPRKVHVDCKLNFIKARADLDRQHWC